ncbi:DUF3519 domain-containing protein [Helicobacter cetorum]|uniref:DUF3519 domain-containing protein n=1 Tax=Helicobacter cetorum TaxID=138563 RepID=UPI0039839FAE
MFKGELPETTIKGRDLHGLYTLEQGGKKHGAIKILKRHYGENKTGAVTSDELLNMGEVIKNGSVLLDSFEKLKDGFRYAYEWDNNGVKLRLVVDDLESNNKIFNFYSDRNTSNAGPIRKPMLANENNTTKLLNKQEIQVLNTDDYLKKIIQSDEKLIANYQHNNQAVIDYYNNGAYKEKPFHNKDEYNPNSTEREYFKLRQELRDIIRATEHDKKVASVFVKTEEYKKLLKERMKEKQEKINAKAKELQEFLKENPTFIKKSDFYENKINNDYIEKQQQEYTHNRHRINGNIPYNEQEKKLNFIDDFLKVDFSELSDKEKENAVGAFTLKKIVNKKYEKPNGTIITYKDYGNEKHYYLSEDGKIYSTETDYPIFTDDLIKEVNKNRLIAEIRQKDIALSDISIENYLKQVEKQIAQKAKEPAREITEQATREPATREWGTNYSEFKGNGIGAIEKLLETKEGYIAGAFHKEGLGDIDLVWGKSGKSGYGLAHILERRIDKKIAQGMSETEAKNYALSIIKNIPEILEKGVKDTDKWGRVFVEYDNKRVGLNNEWNNQKLENHWVVSSYELYNEKQALPSTPQAITKEKPFNSLNSNGANPTQKELIKQEKALTPLQLAEQEKLQKQALEKEKALQDYESYKEDALKREEALKQKLAFERGNAGNLESETKIEVGQDIPLKKLDLAKSRVRLNDGEIFDLDYAIVKAKDLKPSFTTGGTQKRTHMNEEQIKNIAENFDPQKIFGSGGFEDLPIILQDGQVISGNHRIQGMLNFTNKSRAAYDKAIQDYYNITLKPDELLIRVPHKNLNNTEVNNLAAGSNAGRFNSESDKALSVLSHYTPKLKELDKKLNADTIHSLKRLVARDLNFDKATSPNVSDSNLALLMYNMPRSETQGIELLNKWHKEFKDDPKSYEKVKKMFIDNAGSFHNLIHDLNFPKLSLNAYLSDTLDRAFKSIKDYESTTESLKALADKHSASSLGFTEYEKSQHKSDISEILGAALARFARLDDPSNALFEALRSDNIKKGLREHNIADDTKDLLGSDRKVFNDIDIYDFTHYLLKHDRKPNENNQALSQLTRNIKGLQKDYYKSLEKESKALKSYNSSLEIQNKDNIMKKLSFDEIKQLIDTTPRTGSGMLILGGDNLKPEVIEYIQKKHKRVAVEKLEPEVIEYLGLPHKDARAVIDYQAINHILKDHPNLDYKDLANYRELAKNAQETLKSKDNKNRPVIVSFNQVNGFFVVVEQISNAKNELMLKTMYKTKGNYKQSLVYRKALAKSQSSD